MLFIIVHQAYELWFKQILYELDQVQGVFAGTMVDDRAIGSVVHALMRITEIQRLLIQQLTVLETMTPLDFLDFRDLLFPASGSQSLQFRLIETRLGLKPKDRITFDSRPFDATCRQDRERLSRRRRAAVGQRPARALAGAHALHRHGRLQLPRRLSPHGRRTSWRPTARWCGRARPLSERRSRRSCSRWRMRGRASCAVRRGGSPQAARAGRLAALVRALQAALFINLYRDEPALQLPFRLLSLLMDIDELLTTWRYRHALMVQRMIGLKVGTGGSSGHDYLRRTAESTACSRPLRALHLLHPALAPAGAAGRRAGGHGLPLCRGERP